MAAVYYKKEGKERRSLKGKQWTLKKRLKSTIKEEKKKRNGYVALKAIPTNDYPVCASVVASNYVIPLSINSKSISAFLVSLCNSFVE